jgi:hypothetical protein
MGISSKSSEGRGRNKAEAMWRFEQFGKLIVESRYNILLLSLLFDTINLI